MYSYLIRRIFMLLPTLFGAAILVFVLLRLVPGDVCDLKFGGEGGYVDPEQIKMCREMLGLENPMYVQFYEYMKGFLTLDLGVSMWTTKPVTEEIAGRFQISVEIAILATITSIFIALPLGIISAVRRNTWTDYVIRGISISGIAIPSFWLGILILLGLLIFTQKYFGEPWMPPVDYKSLFDDPAYNLSQMVWPALATGFRYSAVATRMTRSAMLEVLREDYVRTARAKGLIEKVIVNRHALKNAMLPVITIIGMEFAFLMGGLVVTEQVFNLNGLGKLLVESVEQADFTMTQALMMLAVAIFVVANFVVDVMYAVLDPRIRYG